MQGRFLGTNKDAATTLDLRVDIGRDAHGFRRVLTFQLRYFQMLLHRLGNEALHFGQRLAKAKYYDEDFIISEVALEAVRRKRTMSPLLRDEDIDLTINELMRIRERPATAVAVQKFKGSKVQGSRKSKKSRRGR